MENKILYDTKFLQLKSTKSKNGHDWVYAHRPNAKDVVVILPIFENEILFTVEERPPVQAENRCKYTIALPAGLVGDERGDETIIEAIEAELLEETGLKADSIVIKSNLVATSPGCTSETVTLAIAYIKDKSIISKPVSDGGVIIDRIWVKKKDIYKWLKEKENEGCGMTAITLAALFYLNEEREIDDK